MSQHFFPSFPYHPPHPYPRPRPPLSVSPSFKMSGNDNTFVSFVTDRKSIAPFSSNLLFLFLSHSEFYFLLSIFYHFLFFHFLPVVPSSACYHFYFFNIYVAPAFTISLALSHLFSSDQSLFRIPVSYTNTNISKVPSH
uniref:Uncharacterized protein n=1 Tax=Cacopsylla melanoneura TaxID=428564 RepID=A0A8D8TQU0_9HEMI